MENEKNVVTYDEIIEENTDNNELGEGKIRLQLGDIIELIDEFEKSNNGIFLIDYIVQYIQTFLMFGMCWD